MKRILPLLTVLVSFGCADVTETTAPFEMTTAEAPKDNPNKDIIVLPTGAAFAMLGPERVQVCLVLPNDDPGNGDFLRARFDPDVGFYRLEDSHATSNDATISVFATITDYRNGNPFLVAQGQAVEQRHRFGTNGANVLRGHGKTDDGTDTTASDPEVPAAGSVFHYLVRAENSCPAGSGLLGSGANDSPRSARDCD